MDLGNDFVLAVKHAAGGRISNESLSHCLATLETENPVGALMSTLAAPGFREALIEAAQDRPPTESLSWMTVAAAGRFRVFRVLAPRAVKLVPPHALAGVLLARAGVGRACATQAEEAHREDEWGAWLLLGRLRRRELRRFAMAEPVVRGHLKGAQQQAKRPVNPQMRGKLRALNLV